MGYSGDNLRSPSTNNLILISYLQGAYNQFTYQEMNAWKEQRGRSSPTWTWILHTQRASTWDSILQSDSTTEVEDTACRSRISEITSQGRSFATKYLTRSEEVTAILPTVLSYFPPMLVVHKQGNVKRHTRRGKSKCSKRMKIFLKDQDPHLHYAVDTRVPPRLVKQASCKERKHILWEKTFSTSRQHFWTKDPTIYSVKIQLIVTPK